MAAEEPEDPAAEVVGEETEVPEVLEEAVTHEPFCMKVLSTAKVSQSANGLRHNDHLRYRQYCTRRLRRLYKTLGLKHGRGRFKQAPFPGNFADARFILVPLVRAERAWSYGVQLKSDNANATAPNPRWRHHAIQRFAKAVTWAKKLEAVCKVHCDPQTQLDAECYCALLEGTWLLEKEMWAEARAKLVRCRKLCEHLGTASDKAHASIYREQIQEIEPMLRECKYNLGDSYEDGEETQASKAEPRAKDAKDSLSGLSYRGHDLVIPSEKIKAKLLKCLEMVSSLKDEPDSMTGSSVIEKYGELSVEFGEVLKDIHADMMSEGADGETVQWRMLEAFAREVSICMNIERNLVLLRNHLSKLDEIEEVTGPEARRICRPEEGMRYCDLLKVDVSLLGELPETSEALEETLAAYTKAVLNYRCLYLALCNTSLGKTLEAAALLDMLSARADEATLGGSKQPEPVGRIHGMFERMQSRLPSRVSQWRCRGLVSLCRSSSKGGAKAASQLQGRAEDNRSLAAFPPKFRDIACKPLLFDLAFPCILAPIIEEMLPKGGVKLQDEGAQKKGLAGLVGGLGNKLGGLWGRK
mmetsp:Transcript_94265/g.170263  ORF Transcript_94265/g.170263 Transcript_94265/m.170263 type:complete len:584 (-) Transcript_94265:120-1871(-)|eukprot:CAMPEP_0115065294 /NCGR_PEP_ID=MMETSP0227-20121206/10168_1 /TAXON_ID=89957 /ORGANISM="Polarella glacialis, Strain CCMP 1383" /LENGTH=583 /DNA_ID=CAMNT_0002451061 /DNA_START=9 /DNA_END=1760 /DNA_ORIENTATION=+